MVQLLFAVKIT